MSRKTALFFAISLLLVVTSCGGSANRQIVSISISPASGTGAVSYTATGTFTASPVSVTPLPVSWFIMGPGIDPPPANYAVTNGAYAATRCAQIPGAQSQTYTVIALAPVNPNAPSSGSVSYQTFDDLIIARTTSSEGGFVTATAQLTCK